jgi:glycosyltransferase involved in cell wall biosynthesis
LVPNWRRLIAPGGWFAFTMTVSIIIRTYNRAHSVAKAICSAQRQTYSDFEIIVVDDASTDATNERIRGFKDPRIRVLRHETNRGVGAACNTGVLAAKGELVAWLDSDDIWYPEKLERQVQFMQEHPEVDGVFSDVCIRHGIDEIPSLARYLKVFPKYLCGKTEGGEFVFDRRKMYLCLLEEIPIKPTALLVRRGVFEKVGMFDETSRSGEDWEFLLRLGRQGTFGYIDRPMAAMRWGPDSTHRTFWVNDKTYLIDVFEREREILAGDAEALNAIQRGITELFKSLAYYYLELGKRGKAFATYLQGFKATRNAEMLFQAAATYIPIDLRESVMRGARALLGRPAEGYRMRLEARPDIRDMELPKPK